MIAESSLLLDQLSKYLIFYQLFSPLEKGWKWVQSPNEWAFQSHRITGFFELVVAWNYGVSFSLLSSQHHATRWLLILLSLAIVTFLIRWACHQTRPLAWTAAGLISGGALGNVIDRLRFGAVADFLYFHLDTNRFGTLSWPAFNLADTAIVIGACLLVWDSLITRPPSHTGN